jgi:hypothetical protein
MSRASRDMFLLIEIGFHLTSDGLDRLLGTSVSVHGLLRRTSSLLLCFARLADMVEVPDISLAPVVLAAESSLGRGMAEGESANGS